MLQGEEEKEEEETMMMMMMTISTWMEEGGERNHELPQPNESLCMHYLHTYVVNT